MILLISECRIDYNGDIWIHCDLKVGVLRIQSRNVRTIPGKFWGMSVLKKRIHGNASNPIIKLGQ